MFIIAQIFGILVIIANILSMQMKNKNKIILMITLANTFTTLNFVFLQSYSATIICVFAIIQTFINKFFEDREKSVPKIIIAIYIILSIIFGFITFQNYLDIIPIICSILFTILILQKEEKYIRRLTLLNILLWTSYDLACQAYTLAISDLLTIISTLIGMYRFDYKKEGVK